MSLRRWDPFGEMLALRNAMDRLFDESLAPLQSGGSSSGRTQGGLFPLDVYEEGDNIVVEADLPGVKPENVDIQVHGDQLLINAQSGTSEEREEQQYFRRERAVRRYTRAITLPTTVKANQAEASFENGCLTIRLPRSEESRPRRIPINGAEQRTLQGESRKIEQSDESRRLEPQGSNGGNGANKNR